jgi:hypothetical protein
MGESFQVLIASKGVARESIESLSGLNFGRRPTAHEVSRG